MPSEFDLTIDTDTTELTLTEFSCFDPDVVQYFQDIDPDQREQQFERALRIGVLAIRSTRTGEQVDFVEKRFNELQHEFDGQLEAAFGQDGDLQDVIDGYLGDDGKLGKMFDPSIQGTPMYEIKQKVDDEFEKLREKLGLAELEAEMVSKTRLKGEEFEEELEGMLSRMAKHEGDVIEFTGNDSGLLGDSKKGDFVIDLNDRPQTIVVEAKNSSYSQPKIEAELEEAIDNRGADYGIFVAQSRGQLPDHVGWLNEYNGNQLVIALGNGEEPELAEEILHIAYKWARRRIVDSESVQADDLDMSKLRREVEAVDRTLKDVSQIKRQCSSIQSTADDIKVDLDDMRDQVKQHVGTISTELAVPSQPSA